ncbi:hypothetical protein [Actinoplanes sp. NPDC051859]|uniref:hypothetical protein n=1 Tax=Actinoplanes sp. NPDC051859 TaxID=3363909 RepID=UPI00379D26CE
MADDWRQAWISALDELEADVEAVERMIRDEHRSQELPMAKPWEPPPGLGPLPLELRPRADFILTRQLEAAKAAALAMTANRRQTAFASRVEAGAAGKQIPTYIDCAM